MSQIDQSFMRVFAEDQAVPSAHAAGTQPDDTMYEPHRPPQPRSRAFRSSTLHEQIAARSERSPAYTEAVPARLSSPSTLPLNYFTDSIDVAASLQSSAPVIAASKSPANAGLSMIRESSARKWISHNAHPLSSAAEEHLRVDSAKSNAQASPQNLERDQSAEHQVAGRIFAGNRPAALALDSRESRDARRQTQVGQAGPGYYATKNVSPQFRAAYEVEQFVWLPIVEHLCREQGAGFDQVLAQVMQLEDQGIVLGLTSVYRHEGRTTLLQCLARRAAMLGLRVCVVDFDAEQPLLAEQLGLAIDQGFETVLTGEKQLDEVLVESMSDQLHALLLKTPLALSYLAESLDSCQAIIAELRQHFQLVLVDMPPLLCEEELQSKAKPAALPEPLSSSFVDQWLVVRDVSRTPLADIARWQRRIAPWKLKLLGVLENRTEQGERSEE